MGVNMEKVALALGTVAFQLFLITFAMTNYRASNDNSKDDAIQAFLIIAYLLFVVGIILLLLMNFSGMNGKIVALLTLIIYLGAATCTVIGAAIFADALPSSTASEFAYSLTTYITGAGCAVAAAVFLMLKVCCGRCCGD